VNARYVLIDVESEETFACEDIARGEAEARNRLLWQLPRRWLRVETTPVGQMPPLWINLKYEFFDAFARGEKETEFRVLGKLWNEEKCRIGRRVVLTRAYRQPHLTGVIVGFDARFASDRSLPALTACFHTTPLTLIACIKIKLDEVKA
jgi:hypothetical protein